MGRLGGMEKKKLYCCSSYYQLLISLMKIMTEDGTADLLLEVHGIETAGSLAGRIREQLPDRVEKVFVCEDSSRIDPYSQRLCSFLPLQRKRLLDHMEKVFDGVDPSAEYGERNVFWDLGYAGTCFNIRKLPYRLLEDSLDSCKRIRENRPNYRYIFHRRSPKFLLKKYLGAGVIPFGFSPYCIEIEVNDPKGIQIPSEKVTALSRKELTASLSDRQKEQLLGIFAGEEEPFRAFDGSEVLLLTEPFALTHRLPDEETQIRMYRDLVSEYAAGKRLVIKAHPRDPADYRKYFPSAEILEKNMPMEVLAFCGNFCPARVMTVTSSAVFNVPGDGEKISLGAGLLKNYQR